MTLAADVADRAADLADEAGMSVDAALARWITAGAENGGREAGLWLSVAFLFGRNLRDPRAVTLLDR